MISKRDSTLEGRNQSFIFSFVIGSLSVESFFIVGL